MQTDFLLKNYNTFQLEVKSNYFTSFCSTEDLITILKNKPSHEVLVLGEGSNVLFTKDFEGLILYNTIKGIEVQSKGENIYLEIGGGENWHDIVTYCVENNWGGIENLALIPGTMAAGPIQNIGAYGVELKDVFVSLDMTFGEFNCYVECYINSSVITYATNSLWISHSMLYSRTSLRMLFQYMTLNVPC